MHISIMSKRERFESSASAETLLLFKMKNVLVIKKERKKEITTISHFNSRLRSRRVIVNGGLYVASCGCGVHCRDRRHIKKEAVRTFPEGLWHCLPTSDALVKHTGYIYIITISIKCKLYMGKVRFFCFVSTSLESTT